MDRQPKYSSFPLSTSTRTVTLTSCPGVHEPGGAPEDAPVPREPDAAREGQEQGRRD